jgi:hypothetical protein
MLISICFMDQRKGYGKYGLLGMALDPVHGDPDPGYDPDSSKVHQMMKMKIPRRLPHMSERAFSVACGISLACTLAIGVFLGNQEPAKGDIYRQVDWDSLEDLAKFLARDTTDQYTWTSETFDCDDFAMRLRTNALGQDKYLSIVWIGPSDFQRFYGVPLDPQYDGHIMNAAIVGNWIYYIEPQTDQIFLGIMIDRPVLINGAE